MYIHHVGYLVKDMSRSMIAFTNMGYEIEENPRCDYIRDANIAFLENHFQRIELVQPSSEKWLHVWTIEELHFLIIIITEWLKWSKKER